MARPKIEIDEHTVRALASILCTMNEIAAVCKCSVDTLERRFADVIKEAREEGKASLRRAQWQSAQKGNTALLIWLGKQVLGQSDKNIELQGILPRPTIIETIDGHEIQIGLKSPDEIRRLKTVNSSESE